MHCGVRGLDAALAGIMVMNTTVRSARDRANNEKTASCCYKGQLCFVCFYLCDSKSAITRSSKSATNCSSANTSCDCLKLSQNRE